MEEFISTLYELPAQLMIILLKLSEAFADISPVLLIIGELLFAAVVIVLLFVAIRINESYDFKVKAIVGAVLNVLIANCAMVLLYNKDITTSFTIAASIPAGVFFIGAVIFLVVNFLLDGRMGRVTAVLWLCEFFFTINMIRLARIAGIFKSSVSFRKVMLLSLVSDEMSTTFSELGITFLFGIIETIALILLMFAAIFIFQRMREKIECEWTVTLVSQIMLAASYLFFEVHAGTGWSENWAYMSFMLFGLSVMLYVFIFCYEVSKKDQEACIGVFFMGIGGLALSTSVVFSVNIVRNGAMKNLIGGMTTVMTKLCEVIPVGLHTNFAKINPVMTIFAVIIAGALAFGITYLLFFILDKVLHFSEGEADMGVSWFRNSAMLCTIPLAILWICSVYGNVFGDNYAWIQRMFQALICLGIGAGLSNIAPAIRNGFLDQLRFVIISILSSIISILILVPVIFAFI